MSQASLFNEKIETSVSFLEEVWQQVTPTILDPTNTFIILPSVRAGLYYKNLYKSHSPNSVVLPTITTIYTFIDKFSPYQTIDTTTSLFELYRCYQQTNAINEVEAFPEFYKWARLLLNDFNEVDNYLIDAQHLYSSLQNLKELEEWSFAEEHLSDNQQNFITFWDKLYPLYAAFDKKLKLKGLAYSGKKARLFAEEMETFLDNNEKIQCHFIGFNALNRAEERIIETLCREDRAHVYWDIDPYYHQNSDQEAGKFFPKKNTDPNHFFFEGRMATNNINIDIIGVPKSVGQVKVAAQIIEQLPTENLSKTAVILANESLLIPLLNSIPSAVNQLNLTMGLPLRVNPLHSLVEALFELNNNINEDSAISTDLLHRIIDHQFLSGFFKKNPTIPTLIENRRYVLLSKLTKNCKSELESCLFANWDNQPRRALAALSTLISLLRNDQHNFGLGKLENEFLFELAKTNEQFLRVLEANSDLINLQILKKLIFDELNSKKTAFIGEPLKGLQIMGMLESRTLDFDNLLILGANEGIMPATPSESSLIPNDLKKYYGLPTHEKREAIYAYYVYRLLHRSKKVYFTYNNVVDQLGGSEMSRFLLQISEELPKINPNAKIALRGVQGKIEQSDNQKFSVFKTPEIIEKIKRQLQNGISPTALNTLITCPLNFYYRYVIGLGDLDSKDEEVSSAEFGTLVHSMLELSYAGQNDQVLTKTFILQAIKNVQQVGLSAIGKNHTELQPEGKTLLSLELAIFQVRRMLKLELDRITDLEKANLSVIYLGSEKEMTFETALETSFGPIDLKLSGKIDRIEKVANTIWIIDYKTGTVSQTDLNISNWEQLAHYKKGKALQLAIYGLMCYKDYPGFEVKTGIISTVSPSDEPLSLRLNKAEINYTSKEQNEILAVITSVIEHVLDTYIPFEHNSHSNYCQYCH